MPRGGGKGALPPLPDVDKMPGDRCPRRHCRRDQIRAAFKTLAALEIAVRGRGTALFGVQLGGVHRKAPRTDRLAAFHSCLSEDDDAALRFLARLNEPRTSP